MSQQALEKEPKESIESLARMIASGFNHVDKQLEKMATGQQLYGLERRLDEQFKEIYFRFDQLKFTQGKRMDELEQRIEAFEGVQ